MPTVEKARKGRKKRIDRKKLLEVLTYEVVDGKPIYYCGYKEVLKGRKQPEEVMGSSTLQWYIIGRIAKLRFSLEDKSYLTAINEAGIIIDKNTLRSADIAIFKKDEVEISEKYADVPPIMVIEVDVKADIKK